MSDDRDDSNDEEGLMSELREAVGLCVDCDHARKLTNAKGNDFYRCEFAKIDESFTAYPPLPVRSCRGYAAAAASEE
jgi:hypothetical protein